MSDNTSTGVPSSSYGFADCIAFVFHCVKHKRVALNNDGRGVWLPYIEQHFSDTFAETIHCGITAILSGGDQQLAHQLSEGETNDNVDYEVTYSQLLRVQNGSEQFAERVLYYVQIKRVKKPFKCCQTNDRNTLSWISIEDNTYKTLKDV